jgi:hypothetical protein
VLVMRREHPGSGGKLGRERLEELGHVRLQAPQATRSAAVSEVRPSALRRREFARLVARVDFCTRRAFTSY